MSGTDYVFVRPNGKPYRPRNTSLRARAWENFGYPHESRGAVVFGTLSPDEARWVAWTACNYWYGESETFGLTDARPGWWRDGYNYEGRAWVEDEDRGVPGVMFTWGEMEMREMNWCGFCLIPVQTGQEPPHKPGCPTL